MKIHGPNQSNFNPYKNHMQKQTENTKDFKKKDQLQISEQAKKLSADTNSDAKRAEYVAKIKQEIDTGSYRVNHEKTADKMIHFYSDKS